MSRPRRPARAAFLTATLAATFGKAVVHRVFLARDGEVLKLRDFSSDLVSKC